MKTKRTKSEEKEEKQVPQKCVCGSTACTVVHRKKYMVCCPDVLKCAVRGLWCSKEYDAIKSFNTAVDEARYRKEREKNAD